MIRHIVFFTAKQRSQVENIRDGLMALGGISGVGRFEVALNSKVDRSSGEIDVVVYAEFADAAALEAYKAHPIYVATTQNVRPLRQMRYAADFEAVETRRQVEAA